jgi:iron complex outermembrane recepter protein
MNRALLSALATLSLLPQFPALAPAMAAPAAGTTPSALDEIVVTASRRAQSVRDIPASVSTVSRSDFDRRGSRSIGDELRGLPGLSVGSNDAGTYTKLVLRGVPNRIHNDTLAVLLDGVPYVTGDDEADLEQLPYAAVGQVDLVRGPMSALYGRGAIAGTVNYLSRAVGQTIEAEAGLELGNDGWRRAETLLQTPTLRDGALLLVGEIQRGDGWRDRTARHQDSLFVKHRLDVGADSVLNLTGSWVDQRQGLAGELPLDGRGQPVPLPGGRSANWNQDGAGFYKRLLAGTATLEGRWAESLIGTTRLHARRSKTSALQGFFNPYDPASGRIVFTGFRVDNDTDTLFAEQTLDWQSGPFRLLGGVSGEQVRSTPVETWTGEFDFGPLFYAQQRDARTGRQINREQWQSDRLLNARARSRNLALYGQADWTAGAVTLSAGARLDRFSRRVEYGPSGSGFGPDPETTISDSDSHISPKASLNWELTPQVTTYLAYGAGFSPGFGPVWSFRNRNTDLAPELADNVETGIKADTLDGRVSLTASLYQLQRRDLLQLLPVGGTARTINTGRQRSRGLELEGSARLGGDTRLNLSYGFTDSVWLENRFLEPGTDRPFDFSGRDVAGVPRHAGRAELRQSFPELNLSAGTWVELAGDYAYDNANSVRAGGHVLWNLAVTWSPVPELSLSATVRNLFDRTVSSVSANNDGPFAYFPQPPRQILLTVNARL